MSVPWFIPPWKRLSLLVETYIFFPLLRHFYIIIYNAEFEIVTEGYSGYDTVFQGWIWQGENNPLFGIMRIWNTGDMIYRV